MVLLAVLYIINICQDCCNCCSCCDKCINCSEYIVDVVFDIGLHDKSNGVENEEENENKKDEIELV